MDQHVAPWLLDVFMTTAVVIGLWAVLTVPAFIAKIAFERIGLSQFPGKAREWASRNGPIGPALDHFFARSRESLEANSDQGTVRIVLDERHARLLHSITGVDKSMSDACRTLTGLGGSSGPTELTEELRALRERTQEVASLGGAIEDGLEVKYADKARATQQLITVGILVVAFASVNGTILNQFFRDLITIKFYGVPVSAVIAFAFVLGEMALGWAVAYFSAKERRDTSRVPKYFLFFIIGLLAIFESFVFGIISNGFDIPALEDHPFLKWWMFPLGIVFVTATSFTGYMFHQAMDSLAEHHGTDRLKREISAVNSFVAALPARWEGIQQRAQAAEASIETYLKAIGGRTGELSGAIERVKAERAEFAQSLQDCRLDDWPQIVQGGRGDIRRSCAQNIGLCLLTLVALPSYAGALALLGTAAFAGRLPVAASVLIGIVIALAFYFVGFLAFERLQVTDVSTDRVRPLRSKPIEYAAAVAMVVGSFAGICWAAVQVLGGWGVLIALLLVAIGGVLVFAGYYGERAMRGLGLTISLAIALVWAVLNAAFSFLRYLLLWLLVALAWLLNAVVVLLAMPFELLVKLFRKPQAPAIAEGQATP